MTVAVEFDGVVKRYGAQVALDEVTFSVECGESVAILGPNGAGKTSALGILLGLRPADEGTVTVLGSRPRDAVRSGAVGAMLQAGGLAPGARVREVVELVRRFYPRPRPLTDLLAEAGLADLGSRRVEVLSGGERQRLRMAVALAGQPSLVVLDEPTVGLDVDARVSFWDTIRTAASHGTTVVFATHYLDEVDANADRVLVLSRGRLIADGTPASIRSASASESRTIRATIIPPNIAELSALPAVANVTVDGQRVTMKSFNVDETLRALYRSDLDISDVEVSGGLQEAFVALTHSTTES